MDEQTVFVANWSVDPLDDGSYLLTISYKDKEGSYTGKQDRFSFSTSAKLLKFIKKNLLSSTTEEAVEEVA